MATLKLNIIVFFGLMTIILSCSTLRRKEIVIKGNYKITKVEKVNNNTSKLVCIVYDKETGALLPNAVVQVNELNIGGFTKEDGTLELDIPAGKYTIKVTNLGNTDMKTSFIRFVSNTKTEIKFNLGIRFFMCG